MWTPADQKRKPDLIRDSCEPPCGSWELNSGPLSHLSIPPHFIYFLFGFVFCFTGQGFSVALETIFETSSFLEYQAGLNLPEILPQADMEPVLLNAFIWSGQKPPHLYTHTHTHTHTHTTQTKHKPNKNPGTGTPRDT